MNYEPANPDYVGFPPALDGTTEEEWWTEQDNDEKWIKEEEEK